jgi:hypothetical protein
MPLKGLHCQVSKLVNSDTCPRPTTQSRENYGICGRVCEGNLEIKTSGRYTFELGKALSLSPDPGDQKMWQVAATEDETLALNPRRL